MLSRASMMMTSLETLKTSFALDIKLFEESVSRDIGTEGYWNQRTEKSLKKGIEYFKQAIDKDPNYALAFAGLADCYALLNSYGGLQLEEFPLRAKAAAEQTLAEAHTTKAYVKFNYDPISPIITAQQGLPYFYMRQYDQ